MDLRSEELFNTLLEQVENDIEKLFYTKFKDTPKPPVFDLFKASAMAEVARRLRNRAVKIEEDWDHFVRDC